MFDPSQARAEEPRGLIFNLQKFSLHDGPGIRTTVFFKGCPLSCRWCHNLESQGPGREPLVTIERCSGCGSCVAACPEQAIRLVQGKAATERTLCRSCGSCAVYCPENGREICGREMRVAEVLAEVVQDRVFYDRSGGGVTFSGGEAMAQVEFLAAALTACKGEGLHTVVDTSGWVPWNNFEKILGLTDLFLFDLKLMDDAAHRRFTGVSNRLILENLRRLSAATEAIFIRFPVIPTINDGAENVRALIALLRELRFRQINLLPYHELGRGKAARLGRSYALPGIRPPSPEQLATLRAELAAAGFPTVIGG